LQNKETGISPGAKGVGRNLFVRGCRELRPMKMLQSIKRVMDGFGKYWSYLAVFLIIFPTTEAVILRFAFNKPSIWTAELTTMIFGIYFMIGGARCEADNGHVAMDIFSIHYKGVWKIAFETLSLLVCFIFCLLLVYFGMRWAIQVIQSGERSESLWGPYLWPSRLAIPIGAVMLFLRTFITYVEKIQKTLKTFKEERT
jgi:TRAP-type mannitol/chloroaromatic compound transport system permease small subunit